ncbi:MAG: DUF3530 family protein [Thiohalomonadales bacterium]
MPSYLKTAINQKISRALSLWIILILGLFYCYAPAWGLDRYIEKRQALQLSKHIKVGKPIQLPLGQDDFFAIYTEATTPKSRGGAILVHGLGAHPDWPQMISPLRRQLPRYGWNTLSIQIGTVRDYASSKDYERLFQDSHRRIRSAIDYFKKRGIYNIILIGHSLGASMALTYISNSQEKFSGVIAVVGVSMYDLDKITKNYQTANTIASIKIPVLDIYGSLDNVEIQNSARLRRLAAQKSANKLFNQLEISGADHFFTGLEKKLLKRIRGWVNIQAPSMEIELKRNE